MLDPERWPVLSITLRVLPTMMVPPISWRRFVDEVGRYLIEVVRLADDSSLATVLAVQHALLPAHDRKFPITIPLDHDYATWHAAVTAQRPRRRQLRRLARSVRAPARPGAGRVHHRRPAGQLSASLGPPFTFLSEDSAWDLDSPVSRPRQAVVDPLLETTP